jgi:hypothetical protein
VTKQDDGPFIPGRNKPTVQFNSIQGLKTDGILSQANLIGCGKKIPLREIQEPLLKEVNHNKDAEIRCTSHHYEKRKIP